MSLIRSAHAAAPGTPAASAPRAPAYAPLSQGRLWLNLSFAADWGRDNPFLDVMRYAREWRAQTASAWSDAAALKRMLATVDADGYPTALPPGASAGTLVLTEQAPETAPAIGGRYRLEWQGSGTVVVTGGRAQTQGANWIEFDYTPTGNNMVDIQIKATAPGNHVRGMRCYMTAHAKLVAEGKRVHPAFAAVWGGVKLLRFMDPMSANTAAYINWNEAPTLTSIGRGPALAELVDMCNELGCDGWFTLPYQANADYVTQAATLVRDRLNPALKAYVEYSNEWWNFGYGFNTSAYLEALRKTKRYNWAEQAGGRSTETMQAWSAVFAGQMHRTVRVAGVHSGWQGLEHSLLHAPGWVAEVPGRAVPHTVHDAIAVTGYFYLPAEKWPEVLKLAASNYEAGRALLVDKLNENINQLIKSTFPYFRGVADGLRKKLVMYEGGTHLQNPGNLSNPALANRLVNDINNGPLMYALYARVMSAWDKIGDGAFNQYSAATRETDTGSFGAQFHLRDVSQSRFRACQDYNQRKLVVSGLDGTPVGGKTVHAYAYLNSLHNHAHPTSAQNASTRVSNWVARMAARAPGGGNTYTVGAQFGHFAQWTVPPAAGQMFEEVSTPHLDPWAPGWEGASKIDVVEIVPDNFDAPRFDPAVCTRTGSSCEGRLLQLIDAWETHAPNPDRRYAVFAGWPALRPESGDRSGAISPAMCSAWVSDGLGAYQQWMELLVNRLQTARPGLDIRLHAISKASLVAYRDTVVGTLPPDELFEELAPHGRPSLYFIAAVADYIELFDEKPPADFAFDPAWGVSPVIAEHYPLIVDHIWRALRA